MPELVREQLAGSYAVRRGAVLQGTVGESGRRRSYGAFRGMSPAWATRVRAPTPEENKENIPPEEPGSSQRRRRLKRSPLPAWYPRTPLRDITVVVKALERRRLRLRETARRRNHLAETSPLDASPSTLMLSMEIYEDNSPSLLSDMPPSTSTESRTQVPLIFSRPDTHNTRFVESAKKVQKTMDEIEKLLMEKFKDMPKQTTKLLRRSTLMSMR